MDDNNFEAKVQRSESAWILLFDAEWVGGNGERKKWMIEAERGSSEDVHFGYAELNVASIPAHYCGIITVPTVVLWRTGRVVDQIVETFDRAEFLARLGGWMR